MKNKFFIIFLFLGFSGFSQQEASNWYFGYGAGMQFNLANGTIDVLDDGQLSTNEGCSAISDKFGNLLFYSDGSTVWNRNHQIMQNGSGLYGDASSSQSAIIVPKPDDENIYYIFTVDNGLDGSNLGFNYSEIDISQNGGLGSVTVKNINLLPLCSEKISAVLKDCVNKSIWVITFASQTGSSNVFNSFHAYEVNNTGVNANSVVSTFGINITDIRGYLKLSPDGKKLANANATGGLFLYDIDTDTGIVSNQIQLNISSQNNKPYGIEFSPNSELLYVASSNDYFNQADPVQNNDPFNHTSSLTQFDLTQPNIQSTAFTVDNRSLYRGGLQLGPDGRIYRALSATYNVGLPYLGVIQNPNNLGAACNYVHNAVNLSPNNSSQGLPPFIQSIFNNQIDIIQNGVSTTNLDLCEGETYTLVSENIPGATYTWTRNDMPLPESDFDLQVTQTGFYEVLIDENNGECPTEGQAFVNIYRFPVAYQPDDVVICDDNNDELWNFNLSLFDPHVLGAPSSANFSVHYYESLMDAQNDQNEILFTFQNTSNPQEIFARVKSTNLERCTGPNSITSFNVEVFNGPVANSIENQILCDDESDGDSANGQKIIDLSQFNASILGNQIDPDFSISYHNSMVDAEIGTNSLPLNYYNNAPYSETIYARIQNDLNPICYELTSFVITINPIPESFTSNLLQCDEDGIPEGFTIFNLNQANSELTGGNINVYTRFYTSLTDAENSVNEIDGNSFNNYVNPQIIYVQVVDENSGCFDITELTLEASVTNANDTVLEVCDDDGKEDGIYEFNLNDSNDSVLSGLPNNLSVKYFETYEDALLEVNELSSSYTNKTPYSQTVYVRVENQNACYGINEIQLTIFQLPSVETELETIYCLNSFPTPITITGGILNDSPSNYYYNWSTGENTSEIKINEAGNYLVEISNVNGCTKSRNILVIPSNIATIEKIDVIDATQNNVVTVLVSGEGDYEFVLDDINGNYTDNNIFQNVPGGIHTVYVRDKNECGIAQEIISVIGFPRYFTPNNDGYNDTWQVRGVNTQFQPGSVIYIFDRYGKLVNQLDPKSRGWDGYYDGRPLPSDDYWFAVTLDDGRIYKDHFTLKR